MTKKKQQEEEPKPNQVIEEKETENVYLPTDKTDGQIGKCCYSKEIIFIHSKLSHRMKRAVLAHELTHAYLNSVTLGEDINEEHVCTLMEWMAFDIARAVDKIYPEKEAKC